MNTVAVAVVTLGEDDTIEWFIKFNGDFHEIFFTLNIKMNDLRSVRCNKWPGFIASLVLALALSCLGLHLSWLCLTYISVRERREKRETRFNGESSG